MSIRKKLLVLLLMVSLVPLVVTFVLRQISMRVTRSHITKNIHTTMDQNARHSLAQLLEHYEQIKEIQTILLGIVDSGKHHKMLLNFSEVEFLSSSFLGTLVKVLNHIREKNGELTLINIGPNILKVFKITQLDKVFTIV